jgi:hypothetical protein
MWYLKGHRPLPLSLVSKYCLLIPVLWLISHQFANVRPLVFHSPKQPSSVPVIMNLRVYALYRRSLAILVVLMTLWTAQLIVSAIGMDAGFSEFSISHILIPAF